MKSYTDLEQSKKLSKFLQLESADMHYATWTILDGEFIVSQNQGSTIEDLQEDYGNQIIPCWSLAALLTLIPKNISRKDKIHYEGQTFIPSFRWEITPTAIYYTDGNDIMDRVSFGYGENNMELIDAVFKMVCWLKENEKI